MFDIIIPSNGGPNVAKLLISILNNTAIDRVKITVSSPITKGESANFFQCSGPKAKKINQAIANTDREYIVILDSLCELLPQPISMWLDTLHDSVNIGKRNAACGPLKLHKLGTDYIDFFCVIIPRQAWNSVGELREDQTFFDAVVDWCERAKAQGFSVKSATETSISGSLHVGSFPIYFPGGEEPPEEFFDPNVRQLYTKKAQNSQSKVVPVTAHISTKNRHTTTLPLAIQSIANQTIIPSHLLIFDDNGGSVQFYSEPVYEHLFNILSTKGCEVQIFAGAGIGQVANHQKAVDLATTDFVWRVDDDNSAEHNVLEVLYSTIISDKKIGAVASLVHFPWVKAEPLDVRASGCLSDIKSRQNVQWFTFDGAKNVQHLHNTFLFRRCAATHGYPKNLSTVGHREETIFTAKMFLDGWKLVVIGNAITWHLRNPHGGIRSFADTSLWDSDESVFNKWAKDNNIVFNDYWLIILDNGLGDHWAFKHILPQVLEKAKKAQKIPLLSVCYPEVFEDCPGLQLISIDDARKLTGPTFDTHNVYNFMIEKSWTGTLIDAFKSMYGL